jgi:hypothetical protein
MEFQAFEVNLILPNVEFPSEIRGYSMAYLMERWN